MKYKVIIASADGFHPEFFNSLEEALAFIIDQIGVSLKQYYSHSVGLDASDLHHTERIRRYVASGEGVRFTDDWGRSISLRKEM